MYKFVVLFFFSIFFNVEAYQEYCYCEENISTGSALNITNISFNASNWRDDTTVSYLIEVFDQNNELVFQQNPPPPSVFLRKGEDLSISQVNLPIILLSKPGIYKLAIFFNSSNLNATPSKVSISAHIEASFENIRPPAGNLLPFFSTTSTIIDINSAISTDKEFFRGKNAFFVASLFNIPDYSNE